MAGLEFGKIETLYERDENDKRFVVSGKLRRPEFRNIKLWSITEKVHGENTRVSLFDNGNVEYGGKTNEAELTPGIIDFLKKIFPPEKLKEAFWLPGKPIPKQVTIYGETYGAGSTVHGSKLYRKDLSVRLFDCLIDIYWLNRNNLEDVARKLGIKCVPLLGTIDFLPNTVQDIEYILDNNKDKLVAVEEGGSVNIREGIVAKSEPMLFYREGEKLRRVMWKLKIRDFKRQESVKLKWVWQSTKDGIMRKIVWRLISRGDNLINENGVIDENDIDEKKIIGSIIATREDLVGSSKNEYQWKIVADCEMIGYKIIQDIDEKTVRLMIENIKDLIQKGVEVAIKWGKNSETQNSFLDLQDKIYDTLRKFLERDYKNFFVAITYDGKILASDNDNVGLLEKLNKVNYPRSQIFIRKVGADAVVGWR